MFFKIFSPSGGLPFHSLSLDDKKFLILMTSNLSIFTLYIMLLVVRILCATQATKVYITFFFEFILHLLIIVQSLSHVRLFVTPWTTACQASLPSLSLGVSVQFSCSVVSDSLQPYGLQHARLPCPSPTPRAC